MRKLFALGLTLAIAATLIGCKKKGEGKSDSSDNDGGNSREKIVQNFCEAFRSCDASVLFDIDSMKANAKFAVGSVLTPLMEMAKSKEPVKTKVLKSVTVEGVSASIIEVTCKDSDTLYFFVGYKKDGKEEKDKIMHITADKHAVELAISKAEELESRKDKKADADGREDYRKKPSYASATNAAARAVGYKRTEKDGYKEAAKADGYNVRKFERYMREMAQIMRNADGPKIGEDDIQSEIRKFRNKSSSEQERELKQAEEMLEMIRSEKNSAKGKEFSSKKDEAKKYDYK